MWAVEWLAIGFLFLFILKLQNERPIFSIEKNILLIDDTVHCTAAHHLRSIQIDIDRKFIIIIHTFIDHTAQHYSPLLTKYA